MLKSIIRPILSLWEKLFSWVENISIIENSPYGLLRMSIHPYKGRTTTLPDGTRVSKGDLIMELHISNLTLAKGEVDNIKVASDIQLLPLFREEIANVRQLWANKKLDPSIKAIWGVTMMGPAMRRLGFIVKPMEKDFRSNFIMGWMKFLKWVFSPHDSRNPHRKNQRKKTKRQGSEYWMSMDNLLEKYTQNSKF